MAERADLVIVGGGTVGGWAAVFARESGAERVVLLEAATLGSGASSRAAGIVRAQGGTPATVALGRWSIDFYRSQQALYGIDSGFREHGYTILAVTEDDEATTRARIAMQRANGLDVRWLNVDEAREVTPILGGAGFRGGSYVATDGCIDPPRNVLAYTVAMRLAGVEVRERTAFEGLRRTGSNGGLTVESSAGPIETERVLLTGGPQLQAVGGLAGTRIPAGWTRHTVCVTEPRPELAVERMGMVFDIGAGLYFRVEEGGLLFGYTNPDEAPGIARDIDWEFHRLMRERLTELAPMTRDLTLRKLWVATIDFTPDHVPIVGPALDRGGEPIPGVSVASPGGHGMMWGPAVARVAADLALQGRTDLIDVTDLGLDRFDADGRSRLTPDPIALPIPPATG
jgi:sarcosine oxidase subunit beta